MLIADNFINMIRISVFKEARNIEPLSPFKWRQLFDIAMRHGLNAIVHDAIDKHGIDIMMNIPQALLTSGSTQPLTETVQATADNIGLGTFDTNERSIFSKSVADYLCSVLKSSNAATVTMEPHTLLTRWKQRKLEKIHNDERHSIDTSIETLRLLDIITANIAAIEQRGFSLLHILTLGHYLRTQGHRVDFVKLDSWLQQLRLRNHASLLASILASTFGFSPEELPFMYRKYSQADSKLISQLTHKTPENKFQHTISLAHYSLWSMLSYWTTLTKDSLSKIEE